MSAPAAKSVTASLPQKLCSMCGLCMGTSWPAQESIKSCVFTSGWLGSRERALFGRERARDNPEEMLFGISSERFVARMKNPLPNIQFTGIITGIAKKAFETGLVEAVVTLHRSPEDYFLPVPVLARSTEEILASGGSKPVLAQALASLEKACQQGIKRLLVIGACCHVQNLREFQRLSPYLNGIEIYVVGIPCTDNVHPKNFRSIFSKISRSHETVRHYEFMQDFTVHLRHVDGTLERVPFFSLPQDISSSELLTDCCRSCFDYLNGLADITVGYIGAPLHIEKMYQWVLVRTEKGKALRQLIADELETYPETSAGDRTAMVRQYALRYTRDGAAEALKMSGSMPLEQGFMLAEHMYTTGPRGLEFVRYAIDTHVIRNYYFVKQNYPEKLPALVPAYVYSILEAYGLEP
ncbi:MAG: Coenzyme F420 hydrogenase/dehydrogenase, beta subunit C-terminal domain [Proteobacteria bacterium]|nr:Coenzyme F420 hydrogenase/dehydrogenase, beta subunit C-terminal domain [Pseudomonadota bacterium]